MTCVLSGSTLHLSGVDLLDGTPVVDMKPYIPEYDTVQMPATEALTTFAPLHASPEGSDSKDSWGISDGKDHGKTGEAEAHTEPYTCSGDSLDLRERGNPSACAQPPAAMSSGTSTKPDRPQVDIAPWITNPPITKLHVRFTQNALKQLQLFTGKTLKKESKAVSISLRFLLQLFTGKTLKKESKADGNSKAFQLEYTKNVEELRHAIVQILENDPRSVYRRTKCDDRLYYFTVDTAHITCWFDTEANVVEVLKLSPVKQSDL